MRACPIVAVTFAVAFAIDLVGTLGCNGSGGSFKPSCVPQPASADALAPAGRLPDGTVILPGGRKLTPAGKVLTVGGFPLAMRFLAGERYAVVTDGGYGDEHLRIIDTQATGDPVVADVPYVRTTSSSQDPALFFGLALSGSTLYVSDGGYDPGSGAEHYNRIEIFDVSGATPQLKPAGEIRLPYNAGPRIPAGLTLSRDGKWLYVANQYDGTLSVVDVALKQEVGRTPSLGVAPYDVVVDDDRHLAYVSLWGGDGVIPVDVTTPNAPMPSGAPIKTGKAPEALALVSGRLFVADADADSVAAVDTGGAAHVMLTPSALDQTGLSGSTPNHLAVDAAHGRLYVANAGENAVQAFDLASMRPLGRIPTGWYPTAVAVAQSGTLLIAAAKGLGAGPTDHSPGKNDYMRGTVQVVPMPSDADLAAGDTQVRANLTRPAAYEVALSCQGSTPRYALPPKKDSGTPISHVFLIVRENKTYDAVLGDLPTGNGSAALTLFGAEVTPNLHALATRFTNLDNFYSNAEQSLQGHEWTTASRTNDYVEKGWLTTWGRMTRPLAAFGGAPSLMPLTTPASDTIWRHFDGASIGYHNYGELVNTGGAIHLNDVNFPGLFFNTTVPDVDKIAYVIDNLKDPKFALEPFSYIQLPNDHTVGTTPGQPTPASMVADNDEATGRFIDALSHSRYWGSSIVFIIEDDPQDGGDHVELHRSPCVVVSPWVRGGYTSSVNYDNPSLWRTIMRLLGAAPLNQWDGNAAAMVDLFAQSPDTRPFTFIPRKVPVALNAADAPLAEESSRIDFSRPDQAPLGRILWKAMRGRDAEPPWGKTPAAPFVPDDDDD